LPAHATSAPPNAGPSTSPSWNTTLPIFYRLVTQDTEFGGVEVPKGSALDVCLGAANRDPARWDDPDRYDLFRPYQRNLGFSGGPHRCLGMYVSLTEMTVALNALFDLFPNLRVDPEFDAPKVTGAVEFRGVSHLHVRLD